MGVTGVHGTFTRCCQHTVRVLRAQYQSVLTVVEVFLHDPLYFWALSPAKAMQRQRDNDDDEQAPPPTGPAANIDAENTLLRLKQKLQGYEYGEPLSVEGQVQQLIVEAQDPQRLCKMFCGWAPWL